MIVHADGASMTYNATGRAPSELTVDLVEQLPGRRIPERHPYSVTVPGFAVAPVAAREWRMPDGMLVAATDPRQDGVTCAA